LLRNCFFSSVSKLKKTKKTLFSWAQKFTEFLVILEFCKNSRPKTSKLTQEVFDFKQKQEIFDGI